MTERYTLISELGRGGMGVVWRARDEESGSIVALKLLHPAFAVDPDYVARFERELKLARLIHSANIVRVLGFGARDEAPYLALELVDGPSLRELLVSHGPYTWEEARPLLAQMAQGLADAHAAGVIHRDLKPSNVLVGSDGVVRIADFGIAKGIDLTRVTGTSTLLGTPAYLAPEGPLDERSDLYSLGIVAYEMLTGVAPFRGTTYQEVIVRHIREAPDLSKLPEAARPIVGWLLAKEPAERPQRAMALLPVLWGGAGVPGTSGVATSEAAPQGLETNSTCLRTDSREITADTAVLPPIDRAGLTMPQAPPTEVMQPQARSAEAVVAPPTPPSSPVPSGDSASPAVGAPAAWAESARSGDSPESLRPYGSLRPYLEVALVVVVLLVLVVLYALAVAFFSPVPAGK